MKYFKNDVKRRDSTESKMNLKNLSKKCLTNYRESDKINKLSATKAEAHTILLILIEEVVALEQLIGELSERQAVASLTVQTLLHAILHPH